MNCRNFYILLQTELCLNMWDLNSVIFVQEDRLFGLSVGKWSSWNFFFAFYIFLIKSEGLGPHSTLIWRGWHGLVYTLADCQYYIQNYEIQSDSSFSCVWLLGLSCRGADRLGIIQEEEENQLPLVPGTCWWQAVTTPTDWEEFDSVKSDLTSVQQKNLFGADSFR